MKRLEAIGFVLATAVCQVVIVVLLYRQRRISGSLIASSDFAVFLAPVLIAVLINTFFIVLAIPITWKSRTVRYATASVLAILVAAISQWLSLVVAFNTYGT